MADKRISQLIERTDILNNDVLPIVASGATTTNKVTISTIQNWMQDNLDVGVTSVGITLGTSGNDVNVTGSPITTSGNITINIPTASATNRGLLSSADWNTFTNQRVPYTGATGNVNLGEYGISSGFVTLDTTPTGTPASQGTIYWDDSRSTAALIMNGTTQHIGQDSFFYVKNSTGYTIPKGTGVGFAGTDGASGHLLIQPFLANGSQPSTYFMGVTAEAITNGGFGQVMNFGELSGVNTSGYSAGALLYASTSVAGAFQTTAPQAPNNIILVAAAVNSTNNGSIIVRPQIGSNIKNDEGVKITSVADKDLLQYKSSTGLWENTSFASLGYVPYTGANAGVNLGTNPLSASQININGASPTGGSYLGFKHSTSVTTGTDGYTSIYTFGTNNIGFQSISGASQKDFSFSMVNITPGVPGGRVYNLPDASGTLALTSDLGNYVTIGTTQTITGAKTFDTTTSTFAIMNSTNANGGVLSFRRNGTNVGHIGNSAQLGGGVLDAIEVRSGVGSSVILKTDGGQITLANSGAATFSGALNGTSASFTGAVNDVISVTSTASTTAIKLNNTNANDWGSNIAFQSSSVNKGFVGLVGSLVGNTDHSICLFGAAGQSIKFFTNANTSPRLTIDSSTGAATFSSSVGIGAAPTGTYGTLSVSGGVSIKNDNLAKLEIGRYSAGAPNSYIKLGSNSNSLRVTNNTDLADIFVIENGGNVGIGTASPSGRLHVQNGVSGQTISNITNLVLENNGTANDFYVFQTATAGGGKSFSITNAGNVGIGTASPSGKLTISSDQSLNNQFLNIVGTQSGFNQQYFIGIATSSKDLRFYDLTADTERMRITSGGFLKASNTGSYINSAGGYHELRSNNGAGAALVVSNTNASSPYGLAVVYGTTRNNSVDFFIECVDPSASRFLVASNGNVTNTNNSYGAISDAKLKENIEDATPKLDDLMKVKVRNYNLIGDDKKQIGVIAQELEEVFPAMIDESEDFEEVEVPQVDEEGNEVLNEEGEVVTTKERISKGTTTKSVKYSVFVPMLIKAMQEQQEQIKSLTEQVEALKSQING